MLWKLFQFIYSFGLFLEALTLQLLRVTRIQIPLTISLLHYGYKNIENDHQIKELLIFRYILIVSTFGNVGRRV